MNNSDCLITTPDGRARLDAERFFAKPETIAKLDMGRLRRLVKASKSWPAYRRAEMGYMAPEKIPNQLTRTTQMFEFPKGFDPAKQRAIRIGGETKIVDIAPAVLAIPYIEPTEDEDPFAGRIARAKQLAAKGHDIDTQVDVWGWGAVNTHRLRREYGKLEVPAAFGDAVILTAPEAD